MKELTALKKKIEKDYGKPCLDFQEECHCCRIWKAFKNLKEELE